MSSWFVGLSFRVSGRIPSDRIWDCVKIESRNLTFFLVSRSWALSVTGRIWFGRVFFLTMGISAGHGLILGIKIKIDIEPSS